MTKDDVKKAAGSILILVVIVLTVYRIDFYHAELVTSRKETLHFRDLLHKEAVPALVASRDREKELKQQLADVTAREQIVKTRFASAIELCNVNDKLHNDLRAAIHSVYKKWAKTPVADDILAVLKADEQQTQKDFDELDAAITKRYSPSKPK